MALLNTHIGSASEFISKVENTNIIFAAEGINRISMIKGLKTCYVIREERTKVVPRIKTREKKFQTLNGSQ